MLLLNDQLIEKESAHVSYLDRAYQFGDGVYEVIRVYNGQCFQLEEHLLRLENSAKEIMLAVPYSKEDLTKKLLHLSERNKVKTGFIYLQLSRGVAERTHFFPQSSQSVLVAYTVELERPLEQFVDGIRAKTVEDFRWLKCHIKSLNLLGNVLAKQEAHADGYFEAVFCRDGIVTEGSSTNIFIVKDDIIYTHPANNLILEGITRNEVIQLAEELGIVVKEEGFSKETLLVADEVFITSTIAEITPVVEIDDQLIKNGERGYITAKLQAEFEKRIG